MTRIRTFCKIEAGARRKQNCTVFLREFGRKAGGRCFAANLHDENGFGLQKTGPTNFLCRRRKLNPELLTTQQNQQNIIPQLVSNKKQHHLVETH